MRDAILENAGSFTIDPTHPSLEGHFPGRPIVPGVVLLDQVARLVGVVAAGFPTVRFRQPVRPGERVDVAYLPATGRFEGRVGGVVVLDGSVRVR